MNRARNEILAGAAFARNQHREVVALHALNLLGDALHGGTRADKPRQQWLEWPLEHAPAASAGRSRAAQRSNPWRSTAQSVRNRWRALPGTPGRSRRSANRGPLGSRPRGSIGTVAVVPAVIARCAVDRQLPRPLRIAARGRGQLHLTVCRLDEHHGRLRVACLEKGRRALARKQGRNGRRIHNAADEGVVAVHLDADVATSRRRRASGNAAGPRRDPVPRRGLRRSRSRRSGSACPRARAGGDRQPAELQVAQAGLIALAEQLEHADALAEIVIRLGRTPGRD